MKRYGGYSRATAACLVAGLCFGWAPQAVHAQTPGSGAPSIDQYVESVPTGAGRSAPAQPQAKGTEPLPKQVSQRLEAEGGSDARQLETIATSPALGAPAPRPATAEPRSANRKPRSKSGATTTRTTATTRLMAPSEGALTAAAGAVSGLSTPVLLLLITLVVMTIAVAAVLLVRRHASRDA